MTEKRFRYDWKTGRFKDTLSNSCATSNMRVLETQINNACYNYEKKIRELKKENEQLKKDRFICLDCEHPGYVEIGCLCEKKDHWTDYTTECEDYEELK